MIEVGRRPPLIAALFAATEALSPDQALAAIAPHLTSLGITRVGDLTGLDVIGIPVFFACRPNSRSLSVCQGKALRPELARLGAIMECAEQALAERCDSLVVTRGTTAEMKSRALQCLDINSMYRGNSAFADDGRQLAWVKGFSAVTGNEILVPYELAGLDFRTNVGWDTRNFKMCSIGLAAAFSPAEAALHALLELIEYDATAPVDLFGLRPGFARPLTYCTGLHAGLDDAVTMVEKAGLKCFFVSVTSRAQMPVIGAFVRPDVASPDMLGGRVFAGFACRFSPEEAAFAALLEAVQSRLTQISGARDDIVPGQYVPAERLLSQMRGDAVSLDCIPRHPAADTSLTAGEKLRRVIETILKAGISDVFFVSLGGEDLGISVIRALSPSLQAHAGEGATRLGMHLFHGLLAKARLSQ
ncbi:YcaO-like family protein [Mesorhizobium sp. ES1-6]|uniref:YcaO-like family protein n=1 Tax=Mesorhizobium sp. ES1-6 TaxID=2876626 RepID=UPI001CCE9429|nr:YcaO-like family protein [Mesorhizobium sp. ES1-6]MBZ9801078.1 YcaO-like family protein [Mesorhizobium sp. ES1-6]